MAKVQRVETMLNALTLEATAKRKKKNRKRTRSKRSSGAARLQDGELRIRKKELLESLSLEEGKTEIVQSKEIVPDTFPWLKGVATSFEKVKWHSMKMYWKPAVGTTEGGLVTMGVRWESGKVSDNRVTVAALTPSATGAVWEDGEKRPLVVPPARLMTRAWYIIGAKDSDAGPGTLEVGVTGSPGKVLGEVWVEYTVTLAGTKSP